MFSYAHGNATLCVMSSPQTEYVLLLTPSRCEFLLYQAQILAKLIESYHPAEDILSQPNRRRAG